MRASAGAHYLIKVSLVESLHDAAVGVADEHNLTAPREGETSAGEGVVGGGGRKGSGSVELRNPVVDGEVFEVHVNNGLHQLTAADIVIPTPVHTGEVHKDDTCGAWIVLLQNIENGCMGVGGIVAVAVGERNRDTEQRLYLGVARCEADHPADAGARRGLVLHGPLQHTLHDIHLLIQGTILIGLIEILEDGIAGGGAAGDLAGIAVVPVRSVFPVNKESTRSGLGGIFITREEQYLSANVANLKILFEIDQVGRKVFGGEKLNDTLAVVITHLVAIILVTQVDDDELRGVGLQGIAELPDGILKADLRRNHAMVQVHITLIEAGAQVEGTNAHFPLLRNGQLLGQGPRITHILHSARPSTTGGGIVSTGDREHSNVGVIRQTAHPVLCLNEGRKADSGKKEGDSFHR